MGIVKWCRAMKKEFAINLGLAMVFLIGGVAAALATVRIERGRIQPQQGVGLGQSSDLCG